MRTFSWLVSDHLPRQTNEKGEFPEADKVARSLGRAVMKRIDAAEDVNAASGSVRRAREGLTGLGVDLGRRLWLLLLRNMWPRDLREAFRWYYYYCRATGLQDASAVQSAAWRQPVPPEATTHVTVQSIVQLPHLTLHNG